MRELPKLYMVIKSDRGFITHKNLQGKVSLLNLEYEPYSDDIYEIIWHYLHDLIGVTDFYLSELGIYEIDNDNRFRIIAIKIKEMEDIYRHARSQFLPGGLTILSKEEMNWTMKETSCAENYISWNRYLDKIGELENMLSKLK